MKRYSAVFWIAPVLILSWIFVPAALADKSAITIESPLEVSPGTTITVKLNVTHNGNNFIHYTNWVVVKINGNEIKRWDYSWNNRPESENFTLTFSYTVNEPVEIIAEANCNMHGSKGPAKVNVKLK